MNREQWLQTGLAKIERLVNEETDYELNARKIRVSCSLPSRNAFTARKRVIGQCWHSNCSTDQTNEIFISPTIDDSITVLAVLLHEVCHVIAGIEAGHGKAFKQVANAIGLTGKMTSTHPDEDCKAMLQKWVNSMGPYPHAALIGKDTSLKKQTTRMLKATCPECGYTIRLTKLWAEKGLPTCICGEDFTLEQGEDE